MPGEVEATPDQVPLRPTDGGLQLSLRRYPPDRTGRHASGCRADSSAGWNFYGVTSFGGGTKPICNAGNNIVDGCGTIFKVTPAGKLTLLHVSCGCDGLVTDGSLPAGRLGPDVVAPLLNERDADPSDRAPTIACQTYRRNEVKLRKNEYCPIHLAFLLGRSKYKKNVDYALASSRS